MIDLKKLGEKFDALYSSETVESFEAWLQERHEKERKCQILQILGSGFFEDIAVVSFNQVKGPKALLAATENSKESVNEGYNSYEMAA